MINHSQHLEPISLGEARLISEVIGLSYDTSDVRSAPSVSDVIDRSFTGPIQFRGCRVVASLSTSGTVNLSRLPSNALIDVSYIAVDSGTETVRHRLFRISDSRGDCSIPIPADITGFRLIVFCPSPSTLTDYNLIQLFAARHINQKAWGSWFSLNKKRLSPEIRTALEPSRPLGSAMTSIAALIALACSLFALWDGFHPKTPTVGGTLTPKSPSVFIDSTLRSEFFEVDRPVLAVGVGSFRDPRFQTLHSPAAEARELSRLFHDRLGVPWPSIRVLDGERACGASVRFALGEIARSSSPKSHIVVYISSHGQRRISNDDLLIACHDTLAGVDGTYISFPEIVSLLSQTDASRVLLILDLCYSGLTKMEEEIARTSRLVVISSGESNRLSFEQDGRSVFSSAFIRALSNPPSAVVSIGGMFNGVASDIAARHGQLQTPRLFGPGSDDFLIATALSPPNFEERQSAPLPDRADLPIRIAKPGLMSIHLNGIDLGPAPGGQVTVYDLVVDKEYLIEAKFPGYTWADTIHLISASKMSDNAYVIYDSVSSIVPVLDSPLWTRVFDATDVYVHPNPPEELGIKIGTNKAADSASVSWIARSSDNRGIDIEKELGANSPRIPVELRLWARGALGGERITVRVGSPLHHGGRPESIDAPVAKVLSLTTQWKEFAIDLSQKDLSSVVQALEVIVQRIDNPDGATMYLKDVAFHRQ